MSSSSDTRRPRRLIIVGGTGRVGSAMARVLHSAHPTLPIVICGRQRERATALLSELSTSSPTANLASFFRFDLQHPSTLSTLLTPHDLVINAAGPFQDSAPVLVPLCVAAHCDYIDISDDHAYSHKAIQDHGPSAIAAGVKAITTTGPFPGISNVMAAWLGAEHAEEVQFRYYVAGTGNAGPSVVTTTYLLSMYPMLSFVQGTPRYSTSMTHEEWVDFGGHVGLRPTYHFTLPEVRTIHDTFHVPSVSSKFGLAPAAWCYLTWFYATFLWWAMRDKPRVERIVTASMPTIRWVDTLVGSAMGIEVRVKLQPQHRPQLDKAWHVLTFTAPDSMQCISVAAAAFVDELIEHRADVAEGISWPEVAIQGQPGRERLLHRVRKAWEAGGGEWREQWRADANGGVRGRWWWNVSSLLSVLLRMVPGGRALGGYIPMVGRFMHEMDVIGIGGSSHKQ